MTFTDILRSLLRRWYVMVAALACIAVAILMVARVDGVYSVRVNLVFLPPPVATADENTLRWSSESLVHFAAVIERSYNGNTPQPQFASIDAPLYGSGQTSGVKVFLPNTGGQWSSDFRDATLIVEAVDPDLETVAGKLDTTVGELQELALELQRAEGVDEDHLISLLVSDETSGVRFVQGSTVRAAASIVVLGLGIGGVTAVLVDRALMRRRERKTGGLERA